MDLKSCGLCWETSAAQQSFEVGHGRTGAFTPHPKHHTRLQFDIHFGGVASSFPTLIHLTVKSFPKLDTIPKGVPGLRTQWNWRSSLGIRGQDREVAPLSLGLSRSMGIPSPSGSSTNCAAGSSHPK